MHPYFARKVFIRTPHDIRECFFDIWPHIRMTQEYGDGPYFQISLQETQDDHPEYWGWKNAQNGEYEFIHPLRQGLELCFPHGTKAEENEGRGKVVGLAITDYKQI